MTWQILAKLKDPRTNWKYILIVVILTLVAGVGILCYFEYFKREMNFLTKFPEIKKQEKVIEYETKYWKVYTNNNLKFEVKYPEDWVFEEYGNKVMFGEKKLVEVEAYKRGDEKAPLFEIGFYIKVYPKFEEFVKDVEVPVRVKDAFSLEDWVLKADLLLNKEIGEKIEFITFGVSNYEGFRVGWYKELGVPSIYHFIVAERNGTIYFIKERVRTAQSAQFTKYDYEKVFQKMLSTFKFLE